MRFPLGPDRNGFFPPDRNRTGTAPKRPEPDRNRNRNRTKIEIIRPTGTNRNSLNLLCYICGHPWSHSKEARSRVIRSSTGNTAHAFAELEGIKYGRSLRRARIKRIHRGYGKCECNRMSLNYQSSTRDNIFLENIKITQSSVFSINMYFTIQRLK